MMQVLINGAMEYDLIGEPLVSETFSSKRLLSNRQLAPIRFEEEERDETAARPG
jgi:ribosomal protein S12 methylthiotransferase